MDIAVLYRAKGSTFWHDITRYLATTSKEILSWDHNIQNKLFEFDLEFWNPVDSDSGYIYIDTGAEIAVTNRTYTKVYGDILAGRVEKVSLPFDKGINEATIYEHNLAYKVTIQNHNFSVTDLSLSFEDILNLSELVNDNILLNAPLGGVLSSGEVVPKIVLSSDVEIEPVNLEGSELDTLITALNQVGYLFQVKYRVEYDSTNTINLIQYLKIFDSLDNSITDTWSTGLNVKQYRNGVIFVDEAYQIAESKLVYNKDASPVKNSLTLNFLVKDPNLTSYYKRSLGGEDLFYIGKAFDVKYVALYIDTTVSSVVSSTVLELPHDDILKMRADQTRLDDNGLGGRMTARITNGSTITFINFTVDASLDKVTLDSALTVSSSDRFELVNCFDILEENLEEYPVDGYVQKHIKPGEDSYVKFFKYDMPRTGQDIVIWYYPVNDSPIRETFEDSKQAYGLRTLRENLNDIFVSETQAEQLFNEYKKLKDPLETISFESQRSDLLTVGRSISVNFGDINKSFTVTEAKTSILNDDSNKTIQNIKLSSYINNLQTIIAKLRNQNKLKDIKANVKKKVSFSSTLAIVTSATQGVMNGISAPEALEATSITADTFILNYNGVSGAIAYKADLSTSPTFDTFISGWNNKGIGTTGYYLVNGLSSLTGPFYYRVRALDSYGNTSANSNVITVIKDSNLQIDAYTLIAWDLNEGSGSSVSSTSPASETGTIQGTLTSIWQNGSPIDTYRAVLNGTDNYIESTDDNTSVEDFTIRLPLNLSEDDLSYSYHVLVSKYDTSTLGVSGGVLYIEYDSIAHLLYFGVSDDTSTFGSPKYRIYTVSFTAIADQDYIIQASFMLQDPSNSNLNKFTVCINGVEVSGTFTETISNIANLFQSNIKYRLGAYRTASSYYYGRFSAYKFYFDLTYRNEAYALIDAQNLGLA